MKPPEVSNFPRVTQRVGAYNGSEPQTCPGPGCPESEREAGPWALLSSQPDGQFQVPYLLDVWA